MGNHNFKTIIRDGNVEDVKAYLSHFPDKKNQVFRYGWNPCHLAVHFHRLDILKYLIEEAEADYKHLDNAGSNLLHHSLYFADTHFEIVKYLLESGLFKFDGLKDEHGNTPLHLAFKHCTLKEIAELNKYYKGLKDVFLEKNDHQFTPLALLKERVKGSEDSLAIVARLQEEIEKHAEDGAGEGSEARRSSHEGQRKHSVRASHDGHKHKHHDEEKPGSKRASHEEQHNGEESKKHSSDEEKGGSKKKHSDEEKGGSKKKHHHHHDDEEKGGSKKKHHHHHDDEEESGSKKKHSDEEKGDSKKKHSDDEEGKKHSDEEKGGSRKQHHHHDDEEKGSKRKQHHEKKHASAEEGAAKDD